MPVEQIRQLMLECFKQWGMPKAIRSDNGEPFGVPTRDVIPLMSIWLKAWCIEPILNRPRRPQDNAHVENNQATVSRWAEVYDCKTTTQMQERVDEVCAFHRDDFPVRRIGNVSRKQVFKSLYQNLRSYEQASFVTQRAYDLLAQAKYPRKVSSNGTISLYGEKFQAGLHLKRQTLLVKFNADNQTWECFDKEHSMVKIIVDQRFSHDSLKQLNLDS